MQRILLPESRDARILQAAHQAGTTGAITPVLFAATAKKTDGVEYITPDKRQYMELLRECHLPKIVLNKAQAEELLSDPIYLAAAMLKNGDVDAVVAGANATTAHVARAALRVVKLQTGVSTLSSFFLMRLPSRSLIMSDCALIIEPNEEQLADIAAAAAASARIFLPDEEPVVAMLSFSTNASASHAKAKSVARATAILRQKHPSLRVIGEVQADAALNPQTAKRKGLQSSSPANILIFPDLNAGNIAYKLVQQLTGCVAAGPIFQGLAKPFNDLSRGATAEDIAEMITITARQAAG